VVGLRLHGLLDGSCRWHLVCHDWWPVLVSCFGARVMAAPNAPEQVSELRGSGRSVSGLPLVRGLRREPWVAATLRAGDRLHACPLPTLQVDCPGTPVWLHRSGRIPFGAVMRRLRIQAGGSTPGVQQVWRPCCADRAISPAHNYQSSFSRVRLAAALGAIEAETWNPIRSMARRWARWWGAAPGGRLVRYDRPKRVRTPAHGLASFVALVGPWEPARGTFFLLLASTASAVGAPRRARTWPAARPICAVPRLVPSRAPVSPNGAEAIRSDVQRRQRRVRSRHGAGQCADFS